MNTIEIGTNFLESSSLPESELLLSVGDDLTLNMGDIGGTSIGAASARISLGVASAASSSEDH